MHNNMKLKFKSDTLSEAKQCMFSHWAFCIGPDDVNEIHQQAAVVREKPGAGYLPQICQTFSHFLQPQS